MAVVHRLVCPPRAPMAVMLAIVTDQPIKVITRCRYPSRRADIANKRSTRRAHLPPPPHDSHTDTVVMSESIVASQASRVASIVTSDDPVQRDHCWQGGIISEIRTAIHCCHRMRWSKNS